MKKPKTKKIFRSTEEKRRARPNQCGSCTQTLRGTRSDYDRHIAISHSRTEDKS